MNRFKNLASDAKNTMNDTLATALKQNANLFTAFAIALIVLVGASIAQGRSTWLFTAAAVGVCFTVVFLFANSRVVIKVGVATLVVLFTANMALQLGVAYDPRTSLGLVWLTAQLFLFFGVITLSYLVTGHRSRWTGAVIAEFATFTLIAGSAAAMPLVYAIIFGLVMGFLVFMFYYRMVGAILSHPKLMPVNTVTEELEDAIFNHCEQEKWEVRKLSRYSLFRRTLKVDFLVWNDKHAYLLHPVELSSKLAISPGRKSTKLVHRGASINPWLLGLINSRIPLWRSRNANIMLVLLDIHSINGVTPEAIGVSIPDSKKKIPVGIYPSKGLISKRRGNIHVMADLEKQYKDYLKPLTVKQKAAMEEIGLTGESEYIEKSPEVSEEKAV